MVAGWSRWLQERSLTAADVTGACVGQFVAARHSACRISPYPPRVFNTMLEVLVEQGVVEAEIEAAVPGKPIDVRLASFEKSSLPSRDWPGAWPPLTCCGPAFRQSLLHRHNFSHCPRL